MDLIAVKQYYVKINVDLLKAFVLSLANLATSVEEATNHFAVGVAFIITRFFFVQRVYRSGRRLATEKSVSFHRYGSRSAESCAYGGINACRPAAADDIGFYHSVHSHLSLSVGRI
jgi:hypothetical protein